MKKIAILLFIILSVTYSQKYIAVVNKTCLLYSISEYDVEQLLLGKKLDLGVKTAVLSLFIPQQENVLDHFVGKSPKKFDKYWSKRIFSGKDGIKPEKFDDLRFLFSFIEKNVGAICILDARTKVSQAIKDTYKNNIKFIAVH